jgi:hypothetical protein
VSHGAAGVHRLAAPIDSAEHLAILELLALHPRPWRRGACASPI